MNFQMEHMNLNVFDLEKSLAFYRDALGLQEESRILAEDGEFIIVFLEDKTSSFRLELTFLTNRKEPYALGDNETHLAFVTDDYAAAHTLHEKMGCICFENTKMGLYMICDPDGYWLEVLPRSREA